jgi:hypothetical protein
MTEQHTPLPDLTQLPNMVVWYGPTALSTTGVRYFISGIFGQYADQRILQWATDQAPVKDLPGRYDYSSWASVNNNEHPVWVDYVADTGDGFDSTYAIASLIAAPALDIDGAGTLEGGKLLLMGGDEVYPYASREQYEERLIVPYRLASVEATKPARKLFALPGNHDWYDGLTAFDQTFCQTRDGVSEGLRIGQWQCPQHHSYFAIKLPYDWWIWGLDTHLTRTLDIGQIRYFDIVVKSMLDPAKAKIILCLPEPAWMDAAKTGSEKSYPHNINRIVRLASDAAKVCAIIAGDTHHYSRYRGITNGLNLITSGGGGAYLSPTHHLPDTITVPSWGGRKHEFSLRQKTEGGPGEKSEMAAPSLFPDRATSRALSWRLPLLFLFQNTAFSFIGLGIVYWMLGWTFLNTFVNIEISGQRALVAVSNVLRRSDLTIEQSFSLVLEAAASNVLFSYFGLMIVFGFYTYVRSSRRVVRFLAAFLHWSAHVTAIVILSTIVMRSNMLLEALWNKHIALGRPEIIIAVFGYPIEMILLGGLVGGVIWGIYLFVNCRFFLLHTDDAFSALSLRHYKHFLRMKVEPDRLTIYPIGLKYVPSRGEWRERTAEEQKNGVRTAFVPRSPLKPHLIEGPIVIQPSDVKDF